MKPIIFFENEYSIDNIIKYKKSHKTWEFIDIYKDQLKELFEIRNPSYINSPKFNKLQMDFIKERLSNPLGGNYIYLPWSGILLHTVNEKEYLELRTNRNRNLITLDEQNHLYDSCIGVVGLSVGINTATALSYSGVAKCLKLADYDNLSTTNLNRVKAKILEIGLSKIELASRQIFEINPYSDLILFENGLNDDNLNNFIYSNPKPKIIFEMIDDFKMKIKIRLEARKAGIPVIMLTNLGDNVLVDIERFDLKPDTPIFNGILNELPEEILRNNVIDSKKYAVQLVGIDNVPVRALESLKEIGKSLVGRPQLFSTLSVSSGIGVLIAREIILHKDIVSGRYKFNLNQFTKEYLTI